MERTQPRAEITEPHYNHETRAAKLLDRIQHDAHLLAQRAQETHPGQEPYRMMRRVAEDLERVAVPLILAVEHCNQMLIEPVIEHDIALLRDTTHLCARVEAMVSQLEDTVRTLERLIERPVPHAEREAPPALAGEPITGDGSIERLDDRPSRPRTIRVGPPKLEV